MADAQKFRKLERIRKRMETVVDDCEILVKNCNDDAHMKRLRDKAIELQEMIK